MNIDIIVPLFNEEKHIEQICQALKTQSYANFHVVLVDNGSEDRTVSIASQYFTVSSCSEKGSYAARNFGISQSQADYLLFLDADVVPGHRWVEHMLRSLNEGFDAVAGKTISIPFKRSDLCEVMVQNRGVARIQHSKDGVHCHFPTCNVGYRRSVFEKLGKFPLETGGDIKFSDQVGRSAFKATLNLDATVDHYVAENYRDILAKYFLYGGSRRLHWYNLIPAVIMIILSPVQFLISSLVSWFYLDLSREKFYRTVIVIPFVEILRYTLLTAGAIWFSFVSPRRIY